MSLLRRLERPSATVYTVLLNPPYLICICMGQLHEIGRSTSEVSSLCRIESLRMAVIVKGPLKVKEVNMCVDSALS
jgi:hypothetical protein